jgi:glycosyltransferase involved in cell wall biosynthesis
MKVSVVSSIFRENNDYLKKFLDSLSAQTFKDFEVIIVDDGASAENLSLIGEYIGKLPKIKIITNEKNLGLTKSLNVGIKNSNSAYIARLDTDDYCSPERLQIQYNFLENHLDHVACSCHAIDVVENKTRLTPHTFEQISHDEVFKTTFYKNPIIHSGLFARKDSLIQIGGYDESYICAQDYNLIVRLFKKGKIVILGECLIYRHISNNQISIKKNRQQTWHSLRARLQMQKIYGVNIKGLIFMVRAFLKILIPKTLIDSLR